MKLFKKLLAVAMVAVLALTVLTGCDTGQQLSRGCCLPPNDCAQKHVVLCTEHIEVRHAANQPPVDLQCEITDNDYEGTDWIMVPR